MEDWATENVKCYFNQIINGFVEDNPFILVRIFNVT